LGPGAHRIPAAPQPKQLGCEANHLLKIAVEETGDFARIHRQYLARLPGRGADAVVVFAAHRPEDDGAEGVKFVRNADFSAVRVSSCGKGDKVTPSAT
jgi:hypothetical protein